MLRKPFIIAILGGTFDPIHLGHLQLAEWASRFLNLDRLIWVPTGNVLYKKSHASAIHRLNMLRLALPRQNKYSIDCTEVLCYRPSLAVHTLKRLRALFPEATLIYLIGEDSWNDIELWEESPLLWRYAHIGVLPRFTLEETRDAKLPRVWREAYLRVPYGYSFYLSSAPQWDISSTNIRSQYSGDRRYKISNFVPLVVHKYIRLQELYRIDPKVKRRRNDRCQE